MNFLENRIDITISVADKATGITHFVSLETLLGGIFQAAGAEEKKHMIGINVENKEFVNDCINEMVNDGSFLPSFLTVAMVQKDFKAFNDLEDLRIPAAAFVAKVSDTQFLAGVEAYAACLIYYSIVKAAAKAGLPGAQAIYNRLKPRFAHQGLRHLLR